MAPGAVVEYNRPTWFYIQIAADVVLGALILFGAFRVIRRVRKNSVPATS
jgi:hypothetical protein